MAELSFAPSRPTSFAEALLPVGSRELRIGRDVVLVFAASMLLTLSAKVQVPMWPVPMTMQSFVVIFLGAALGPRLAVLSVLAYLAQGIAGLPVFAATPPAVASLGYLLGPTGGFLLAFVPAAWVAGRLSGPDASIVRVGIGMFVAHALILVLGMAWLAWLAQLANGGFGIGLERAFATGVQPFIFGALIKVALATALVAAGWTLLRRR